MFTDSSRNNFLKSLTARRNLSSTPLSSALHKHEIISSLVTVYDEDFRNNKSKVAD